MPFVPATPRSIPQPPTPGFTPATKSSGFGALHQINQSKQPPMPGDWWKHDQPPTPEPEAKDSPIESAAGLAFGPIAKPIFSPEARQTISDTAHSGMKQLEGLGQAIAHPVDTVMGMSKAGAGAIDWAADALFGKQPPAEKMDYIQNNRAAFDVVKDDYVKAYGSPEAAQQTIKKDPFRFMADVAAITTGGGSLLSDAGIASKSVQLAGLGEKVSAAGELATKAAMLPTDAAIKVGGVVTEPIINASKQVVSKAKTAVSDFAKPFKNSSVAEAISGVDTHTLNVLDPNRTVPRQVSRNVTSIADDGSTITKNVLEDAPSIVSPETQVSISDKFNRYVKKAQRAAANPAEETPLEVAGKKGEEALGSYNQKLDKWGRIKQEELMNNGEKMMDTSVAKENLQQKIAERVGATIDSEGNVVNVKGKVSKISLDPADNKLLKDVHALINNLDDQDSLLRVDGTVDAIQDLLYKRKQNVAEPVNSTVEGVLKEVTGQLNEELKTQAGPRFRKANDKYSYFVDTRNNLNKALGVEGSKGGSLMKRVFSPTDGGMKALFKKIKNDTGVDLVQEAAMAKSSMELAGDTRQRNLLESLDLLTPGGGSMKGKLLDYVIKKGKDAIANPLDVAKKAARGTGTTNRK